MTRPGARLPLGDVRAAQRSDRRDQLHGEPSCEKRPRYHFVEAVLLRRNSSRILVV